MSSRPQAPRGCVNAQIGDGGLRQPLREGSPGPRGACPAPFPHSYIGSYVHVSTAVRIYDDSVCGYIDRRGGEGCVLPRGSVEEVHMFSAGTAEGDIDGPGCWVLDRERSDEAHGRRTRWQRGKGLLGPCAAVEIEAPDLPPSSGGRRYLAGARKDAGSRCNRNRGDGHDRPRGRSRIGIIQNIGG
jgi:hypothetical protein